VHKIWLSSKSAEGSCGMELNSGPCVYKVDGASSEPSSGSCFLEAEGTKNAVHNS